MNYHLFLPLLLLAILHLTTSPCAGQSPRISTTEKGLVIDAGSMGKFSLPIPATSSGKQNPNERPVVSVQGDGVTVQYVGGGELSMKSSKDRQKIVCSYAGFPAGTKGLAFSMSIPMTFKNGGYFSFNQAPLKPFPDTPEKKVLGDGGFTQFNLVDPMGVGFALKTPQDYQQLQDGRTFNYKAFKYSFFYNFDTHPAKSEFEIAVGTLSPAAITSIPEQAQKKFLVDKFGQSARKDYPGKITSVDELKADAARQLEETFKPNPKLDQYGGLAGSGKQFGLKKTGFFHVGEADGRKVLVTPEGNLFFQLGMCGIASTDDHTLVKGREKTYEWLPAADDAQFLTAWRESKPKNGVFSFYAANLIRKFGRPFDVEEWRGQVVTRLRRWGFNSAGAFSGSSPKMREMGFPTVSFLPGGPGVKNLPDKLGAGALIDPFTPGIEEALDKVFAEKIAPNANDPLLIGYFQGNEQHFENLPKVIPAYKASLVPAKAKLVSILKEKYGNVSAFNTAWNPPEPLADWDAVAEGSLSIRTDVAAADMREFFRLYLETYYSLIERTFRKYDSNHLLIGSRWTPSSSNNEDTVSIGSKYLDVLSINYYVDEIEKAFLDKVHRWSGGKPIILSEWHYCAADQGLGTRKEVKDQEARGKAYRNYVEQSAALPYVVGSQWFIYGDQSLTGRFFSGFHGEGNNTGFVNVADRPYEPLVEAAMLSHARIYDVMLGKADPYLYDDPRFNGQKSARKSNRVMTAMRALPGIKLDGTTNNWPGVPGEAIESSRLILGLANPDISADYRLCWDETNLYFFIQVKDKTPLMNAHKAARLWCADGVELFFGHQDLTKEGHPIFSDRQILLGASKEAKAHVADHPEESKHLQVLAIKDVSGDGYVLEAFIPWSSLGIKPKAGQEILFDVAVDFSDDGMSRSHQLSWNASGKISEDRGGWGRLRLE